MYCEHCGTQIEGESKFCPECGKSSSNDPIRPQTPPPPKPEPIRPRRRWWLWLLWVIFALLAMLYWVGSSVVMPQDIILGQLESMRDGKLTEAYYEYTSKEFQKSTTLEVFKTYVKESAVLKNVKSFLVEDETEEGDRSTIRGFIVAEDGSSIEVVYKLVLEEGKWKIISFSPIMRGVKEEQPQPSITKQVIEPVQTFLDNIQKPEFAEIYRTRVSKNFQENTSYEKFQKFLTITPIMQQFTDYEIVEHYLNRGLGEMIIHLNPEEEAVPVAFTVVKEDGTWKIFRISLGESNDEESLKTKELFDTVLVPYVKSSLQLLKDKNLTQFYEHKTTADFREDVDLVLLEEFHTGLPLLTYYQDVSVVDQGEAGDLAWLDVEIKKGAEVTVLEFTLGQEGGDWKIWGIRIHDKDSIQ